jgi:hypothetical protein
LWDLDLKGRPERLFKRSIFKMRRCLKGSAIAERVSVRLLFHRVIRFGMKIEKKQGQKKRESTPNRGWRLLSCALFLAGFALAVPAPAYAAGCTVPAGIAGDMIYNNSFNTMQYCNGSNWVNMGSASALVGTLTSGDICTANGNSISCTTTYIALGTQVSGTLNAAQFPALTGDVTTSTGSVATTVASIGGKSISLGGSLATAGAFSTSGAYSLGLTTTGTTNLTLPLSGTVVATATASPAQGDLLYYNGTAWTDLGVGTSGQTLLTQGPGANPIWGAVTVGTTSVTGTFGVASGGTGQTSLTAHAVMIGEGVSPVGSAGPGTTGQLLIGQGVGFDPAFETMSSDVSLAASGAATIATNAVTSAKFRQSVAASVVGNPTGSAANVTDITGSAGQVLTVGSNSLAFGAVNLASSASVTGNLPVTNLASGSGASSSTYWRGDGSWGTISVGTAQITGTLGVAQGGTGDTTLTAGGVLYGQDGSPVLMTGAPSQYNVLVGTGGGVPAFGQVALNQSAAVTGTLPVGNGGTGLTGLTGNAIYRANSGGTGFSTSALSDNGTVVTSSENVDVSGNAVLSEISNDGSTGTVAGKLAKLNATGSAITATVADTDGVVGVVVGGAGASGNAQIAVDGQAQCVFDGATTAGDYVTLSATTAGDCHDAGVTRSGSSQTVGRVLTTNASGGTYVLAVGLSASGGAAGATTGSGTANYVARWTGTTTLGTGKLYDNGTNVGIGTTSPAGTLDVEGSGGIILNGGNVGIGTTSAGGYALNIGNAIEFTPGSAGVTSYLRSISASPLGVGTFNSVDLSFLTGNATQMTIKAITGNVGIGTTSPNAKFQVVDSSSPTTPVFEVTGDTGNSSTYNSIIQTLSGNRAALLVQNSQTSGIGRVLVVNSVGTTGDLFETQNNGTSNFVIQSGGNVGIGTTTPQATLDIGTGQIAAPLGSATLPGYSFEGNSNSGLWFNGSGVQFTLAGTNRFQIASGGITPSNGNGFDLVNATALSTTAPNIVVNRADLTTGFASGATGNINVIIGGAEMMRWTSTGVGIGTTAPNANSILQLYSTTKGFLPPQLNNAQESAMGTSLPTGLVVYNTQNNELESFNGTSWEAVGAAAADAGGTNGQLQYNNGGDLGGTAGLTWDSTNDALTLASIANPAASVLTITGGTLTGTTSYPALNVTQTWNNAAGTFTGILENVTATSSNANSKIFDFQVGGTSEFYSNAFGGVYANGGVNTGNGAYMDFSGEIVVKSAGSIGFSPNSTVLASNKAIDTMFTRQAAANMHLGATDAAAPVAQTLGVQNVVAGTTNTAGANFTLSGSQGTGTGAGGSILFQTAPASTTGSTQNALATAMTILGSGNVGIGTTAPQSILSIAQSNASTGFSIYGNGAQSSVYGQNFINSLGSYVVEGSGNTQITTLGSANSVYMRGGSAGYVFINDSNAGNVLIASGGGSVGIGTTSPTSLLHTYEAAAKTAAYTGVLHNVLDTSSTASVNKVGMDIESTGAWNGTSAVNTGLVVNATGGTTNYAATFMGGNVGIGTTVPAALIDNTATSVLDFVGSGLTAFAFKAGTQELDIAGSGSGVYFDVAGAATGSNNEIHFRVNNTNSSYSAVSDVLDIASTGNVGIGTTAPQAGLHINNIGSTVSGTNTNKGYFIIGPNAGNQLQFDNTAIQAMNNNSGAPLYLQYASGTLNIGPVTGTALVNILGRTSDNTAAAMNIANSSASPLLYVRNDGNVGIGTSSPNASAGLQIYSTTKGFLPPQLNNAQESAMGTSLPTGLVVYNTQNNELESFNGSTWEAVGAAAADAGGTNAQLQYNNGGDLGGTAGMTWDNTNDALTLATIANPAASALTITGGTLTGTTSYPALNVTQTWNNASGIFTGILENVTNTTSAATSKLIDLQVGGTSEFNVNKSGLVTAGPAGFSNSTGFITDGGLAVGSGAEAVGPAGSQINLYNASAEVASLNTTGLQLYKTGSVQWSSTTTSNSPDTFLTRQAAATIHHGAADAAAPVAQTLGVQNVVAGTTNAAGANFTITGSQGTGTGAGGSILFQTAPAGSTGTTQNALATAMTIAGTGNVGIGTTAPTSALQVASGNICATSGPGGISYFCATNSSSNGQIFLQNSSSTQEVHIDTSGNTYFNGGNVGIGTTSPSNTLSVSGSANITGNVGIGIGTSTAVTRLFVSQSPSGAIPSLSADNGVATFATSTTPEMQIGGYPTAPFAMWMQVKRSSNDGTSWPLAIQPLGGNVGIGTSSPANALDVNGSLAVGTYAGTVTGASNELIVGGNVGINTTAPQVKLDLAGSLATNTTGTEDEFHITRAINSGTAFPQLAAFLLGTYNTSGSSAPDTRLDINLKAVPNATLTGDTNVMTLQSNGFVGIGTTAPAANLSVYNSYGSGIVTGLTQSLNNAGLNIMSNYVATAYTPGIFWSTANNNSTLPKAGIWTQNSSTGSSINFGTSNSFATGITNEGVIIDPNGYLGVNTVAPQVKLDVTGSIATNTVGTEDEFHITRLVQGGVSWAQVAAFQVGTYNSGVCCGPDTRLDINLKAAASGAMTGDTNVMTLQSNGNVGIGTTSPANMLHVYSSATTMAQFQNSADYARVVLNGSAGNGGDLVFQTAGASKYGLYTTGTGIGDLGFFPNNVAPAAVVFSNSGNVGIGTTAPSGLLDVYGGHMLTRGGTAPTISACGTSPSISGSDNSFKVTAGTGGLTACVINFGVTWTTAPNACVAFPANATAAATGTTGAYVSAISTTQMTITGANLTSAAYYVHCN